MYAVQTTGSQAAVVARRYPHLDGLRGIAALVVVASHYLEFVVPYVTVGHGVRHGFPLEVGMSRPPFNVLWAGNLAVCIFLVHSGFVLSVSTLRSGRIEHIRAMALRRFIRLGVPVTASILVAYPLMTWAQPHLLRFGGITGSTFAPLNVFDTTFRLFLRELLGGGLLRGTPRYNGALWTMPLELVGSYLIFGLVALFGQSRYRSLAYCGAAVWILVIGSSTMLGFFAVYLIGFVIGITLADAEVSHSFSQKIVRPATGVALVVGFLYLGSYNGGNPPPRLLQLPWERAFDAVGLSWFAVPTAHFLAATIAVYAVLRTRILQRLLSTRLSRFLGRLSFPIYLLHAPILVLVVPSTFLFLFDRGVSGQLSAIAAVSISLSISIGASALFSRFVDQASIRLAHRVFPTPSAVSKNSPSTMEHHEQR